MDSLLIFLNRCHDKLKRSLHRFRRFGLLMCAILLFTNTTWSQEQEPTPYGISGLAFSPDGQFLAATSHSGSPPGPVVMWNVDDWSYAGVYRTEKGALHVDFSPDGAHLAYASRSGKVSIINLQRQSLSRELNAHTGSVLSVDFAPDGKSLASSGVDGKIKIWSLDSGQVTKMFDGHVSDVFGVAISSDGRFLVSGSKGGSTKVWDIENRKEVQSFVSNEFVVRRVSFSNDGKHFLTSRFDGHVRIRDTETGTLHAKVYSGSMSADLASDGNLLATSGWDSAALVYKIRLTPADDQEATRIENLIEEFNQDRYEARITAEAELEEIGLITEPFLRRAMKSDDAETRVRARRLRERILSPEPVAKLGNHSGRIEVVAFSPDGKLLATGCRGGDIVIWNMETFTEIKRFRIPR